MPPVTGGSAEPAGQAAARYYDNFAEAYSAENEVNLHNAYYERPAMLALAGGVAGRLILDVGCGSGPLAELRRVLRPGGRLIASVNHPIAGHALVRPGADYWATYQWSEEITAASGQSFALANWHRPLPAMISAFTAPAS